MSDPRTWRMQDTLWRRLRAFGATLEEADELCERAAILEHDGGMDRKQAEKQMREAYLRNHPIRKRPCVTTSYPLREARAIIAAVHEAMQLEGEG